MQQSGADPGFQPGTKSALPASPGSDWDTDAQPSAVLVRAHTHTRALQTRRSRLELSRERLCRRRSLLEPSSVEAPGLFVSSHTHALSSTQLGLLTELRCEGGQPRSDF